LTLAGLLSALLTALTEVLTGGGLALGMIFGLTIAFCLYRLKWARSVKELAGFVVICTLAYAAAYWIGLAYPSWFPLFRTGWNGFTPPPNTFFVGGLVGGAISVTAFLFLLRIRNLRSAALIAAGGSFISGLLGVAGWLWDGTMSAGIDRALGAVHIAPESVQHQADFASIFITWQTGMAFFLGVSLWLAKLGGHAKTPQHDSPQRPFQIKYP